MTALSYGFAKRHGVVVTGCDERGRLLVAHRPSLSRALACELRRHCGQPLALRAVDDAEFDALIRQVFEGGDNAAQMMDDLGEHWDLAQAAAQLTEPEDLLERADDAPIIRLINALLAEAIAENASDIHLESFEQRLAVRFRIDGVLRDVLSPPRAIGPLLVSRIKVMARLDIAEKRLPQDGRISLRVAGRGVDVRVSTIPAGHGERVVLRLLDKSAGQWTLAALGLEPTVLTTLKDIVQRPHGIVLVTGPTGSGKTTTLYAALSHLNDRRRNIMTVEDPIEYYLDGISQTQVNPRVDMSFARGLRAILRQDPDVIMVGEIRDLETADIAVQASLTGHLVLSTLHTNSAVGAVTRLRDMGVEPFLLASSLVGLVAQRLVRRLCLACRTPSPVDAAARAHLGDAAPDTLYEPVGCDACRGTGYRGRVGIFEVVAVAPELQALIHEGCGEVDLWHWARRHSQGIDDHGRQRVVAGETSLAEWLRVSRQEA